DVDPDPARRCPRHRRPRCRRRERRRAEGEGVRRRGGQGRDAGDGPQAVHRRADDEPDADAQGRHHRLPGVRQGHLGRDHGQADQLRGVLRRLRRDGAAGEGDRVVGHERLREDPGDELRRRAGVRLDPPAGGGRREAERDRPDDAGAGAAGVGRPGRRAGRVRVGVRRPGGRHRPRPGADDGRGGPGAQAVPEPGADLGQPARAAEHLPGRPDRVPRHHGDERRAEEARPRRQGPRRVLAGDGEDVLHRRAGGGVQAV
ncbi:MAG: Transaldolase, partial [uncultured Phycisphaerae bacterium]